MESCTYQCYALGGGDWGLTDASDYPREVARDKLLERMEEKHTLNGVLKYISVAKKSGC